MSELPPCPKCASAFTYEDRGLLVCPECAHEWTASSAEQTEQGEVTAEGFVVRDANGVELKNGDAVVLIKDLKVKGATSALKAGTKVKNIRLVDSDHNIDCKIDGFGAMALKSEFVKRA